MKIYVDTNVYLDYLLSRKNSKYAFQIFKRALKCHFHIIVSDHLLFELHKFIEYSDIKFLFVLLKHKIITVSSGSAEQLEAKKLGTHYADALHIVLAKKANADIIITNNASDFESFFKTKRPEDF